MSAEQPSQILADRFEIGGEDLFAPAQAESDPGGAAAENKPSQHSRHNALDDLRVRVGTLLKTETVSCLLGAGASVACGGQLIGTVPLTVERDLHTAASKETLGDRSAEWLTVFYMGVQHSNRAGPTPVTRDEIISRRDALKGNNPEPLQSNFEHVLATLHRWRSALPAAGGRLRIDGSPGLNATSEDLDQVFDHATRALARACKLPTPEREPCLAIHKTLTRKLLTRPLNLKRVNIFTLNYDTLVEQAADATGVVLLDGFVGTRRRIFRPESYEQDFYFPAETTEGRVHRLDRVLHLYKLHGSITWTANEATLDNPYGVQCERAAVGGAKRLLIYPTPLKYGKTLGSPYAELFRRFANALVRPQSVLFVIGYGFGDEHVNAIIRQALAVPSFTLVIVDPAPRSEFVKTLRALKDRRVWIIEGAHLGTLAGFVDQILPDLRDEEIRKKVFATHRALASDNQPQRDAPDVD